MPSIATLPAPGPFERVVDVRIFPHGFTTRQGDTTAGPAGSAIVRPNLEDGDWHAAATQKWGGNIVWTGSTPRHTVAYNGPRALFAGEAQKTGISPAEYARHSSLSYNGAKIDVPGVVFGAGFRLYDSLPTEQVYSGAGNGTLTMQTPSTAAGALTGDYTVRCITASPAARFVVIGPDSKPVGIAEAGPAGGAPVLFDGVLRFALQSGAVAFAVDDQWTVAVEQAEQIIAITEGVTSTPGATVVRRRGVSPGSPWRTVLTIDPSAWEANEQFPTPHFWSIDAAATRAVTTRWSTAGYLVHREIDLDARTHDATLETPARWGANVSIVTDSTFVRPDTGECLITGSTRTDSAAHPGLHETTVGRFFVGNTLASIVLETTHALAGVAPSFRPWPGDGSDGIERSSATINASYTVDIVVAALGFRLRVLEDTQAFYGEINFPGGPYAYSFVASETRREIQAITPDFAHVFLTETVTTSNFQLIPGTNGWEGPQQTTMRWVMDAEVLETTTSTTDFSGEVGGWPGGPTRVPCDTLPTSDTTDTAALLWLSQDAADNSFHVSELGLSTNGAPLAALSGQDQPPPLDATQPAGRKAVFQTAAQDTRGNWMMIVKSPATPLALRTGGPDSLTPATVATLTAYSPDDRWGIGAF